MKLFFEDWWREQDLNLRTLTRADLQSAAIDHSAIPPLKNNGAGEGNRTLTASLEGWNSTIELHPLKNHVFALFSFKKQINRNILNAVFHFATTLFRFFIFS